MTEQQLRDVLAEQAGRVMKLFKEWELKASNTKVVLAVGATERSLRRPLGLRCASVA